MSGSEHSSPSLLGDGDRRRSRWWRGGRVDGREQLGKIPPSDDGGPSVIAARCHLPCGAGEE